MNVHDICIAYLNSELDTVRKKPKLLKRLIQLLQFKQYSTEQIALEIGISVDTVKKYAEFPIKPKPIKPDQKARIDRFLGIA